MVGDRAVFNASELTVELFKQKFVEQATTTAYGATACLQAMLDDFTAQIKLTKSEADSGAMEKLTRYVSENYKKPLTLTMLAQELGYDYYYFSKLFNTIFKIGFNEYLNNCRCIEASALLKKSELSVTEIAYESGFQSIRSFNNAFKKFALITPSEFRKVLGEELKNNGLPLGVISGKTIDK